MPEAPSASLTVICDDVRQESKKKVGLSGVYPVGIVNFGSFPGSRKAMFRFSSFRDVPVGVAEMQHLVYEQGHEDDPISEANSSLEIPHEGRNVVWAVDFGPITFDTPGEYISTMLITWGNGVDAEYPYHIQIGHDPSLEQ